MNRGCIIAALGLVFLIAIAGIFAYRSFRSSLEIPQEYASFGEEDSVKARLNSRDGAPHDSTALTARDVTIYLQAFDAINSGWKPLEAKFDSLGLRKGSNSEFSLLSSPQLLNEIVLVGPRTKKALVEYLNGRGLSLEHYIWLKEHVVAASGIRRSEVDSAFEKRMEGYFGPDTELKGPGDRTDRDFNRFFDRVDSIRAAGMIDTAEAALVVPHRQVILEEGLPSLMGIETNYSFKID